MKIFAKKSGLQVQHCLIQWRDYTTEKKQRRTKLMRAMRR